MKTPTISFAVGLLVGTLIFGCCEETVRFPQYHFYQLHILLDLEQVAYSGSNCTQATDSPPPDPAAGSSDFDLGWLSGAARPEIDRIHLVISNGSQSEIVLDLTRSQWIDEDGIPHRIEVIPSNPTLEVPLEKSSIAPLGAVTLDLAPDEKRYRLDFDCNEDTMYREPLIPFNYRGRGKEAVQKSSRDLQTTTTRVHLLIPVAHVGAECTLRFTWRIRDTLNLDQQPSNWGETSLDH